MVQLEFPKEKVHEAALLLVDVVVVGDRVLVLVVLAVQVLVRDSALLLLFLC